MFYLIAQMLKSQKQTGKKYIKLSKAEHFH